MGGMLIWFAVLIPYLVFSRFSVASLTVFIAAMGNAIIGFADDWIKIVRKRSLGLSARYKLLLQLLLSLFIGFVALHFVGVTTAVDVPFTSFKLELGTVGFYALIFLTLAGFSNAVNLTDGLDGLAAGASAIVLVALAGIAFIIGRNTSDPGHHRPHGHRRLRRAARRSGSSGTTPSPPTCSWATPARSASAARSPAWP